MLDCYGSVYFARRLQKLVEVGEVGLESNLSRGNECDWFTESRFVPGQEGYVAAQDWVLWTALSSMSCVLGCATFGKDSCSAKNRATTCCLASGFVPHDVVQSAALVRSWKSLDLKRVSTTTARNKNINSDQISDS
jgi:hypothetical protein